MTLRIRESVTPPAVWASPITAQQAAAGKLRLQDIQLGDGDAYWIEGRPVEHGRCVIVREHDGVIADVLDAPYSARTSVHEYGAGRCAPTRGPCISPMRPMGASTPLRRIFRARPFR